MADSNITKRALANSLKELMLEEGFSKISIGDICKQCEMNRKSFYYHFHDKYELINWIFDFEFLNSYNNKEHSSLWDAFFDLCTYFYNNRVFYRQAFKIGGQNSFAEHLGSFCYPVFLASYKISKSDAKSAELQSTLLSDTFINSIKIWLSDKECIPPEKFVELIRASAKQIAVKICSENY